MASHTVTYDEFEKQCAYANIILLAITVFSIVKIVKDVNVYQYVILLIGSVLCNAEILTLKPLVKSYSTFGINGFKLWQEIIFDWTLVSLLGILSIYVIAFKGVYGLYLVIFKHFTFWSLIYRIVIIYVGYKLITATSAIQTVYLSIKKGKN